MSNYIHVWGTLDNFSWDGTNISTVYFYPIHFVKGIMPAQSQYVLNSPEKSGVVQVNKKFNPRPLTIQGYIEGTSHATLITRIQALSSFLYEDSDVQLIYSNESDRYYNAQYLDYVEIKRRVDYALLDLKFLCNDPFGYDITADTDTQAGITTDDTTFSIANGGHYYAYPTITITFNQVQTHIYIQNNTITGNRIDISKSFAVADELEIDCKNETVKLNGSHSPAGTGDGGEGLAEWIVLATGANQLQVGTDDGSIDIDVVTSFEKVYLS